MTGQNDLSGSRSNDRQESSTSFTLLDRAKTGDQVAWGQLEFIYTPLVHWWCKRHGVRKSEEKKDVTQDVFQAVVKKLPGFMKGRKGSFRSWLRTITQRKIFDLYRRNRKTPQAQGGSDAQDFWHNVRDRLSDSSEDEDNPTERTILIRRALDLIRENEEFQPRTLEAALRVVVEEQSTPDVAAALGMSVSAVWTAKSRVLGRLRQLLEDVPIFAEKRRPS
jgi:RNA polymerase sigma-70 factor (ECF subfamily)